MKIAIVRERPEGETRVAATPETVGKLIGLGASVAIETGAGAGLALSRCRLCAAGATHRGHCRGGAQGCRDRPDRAPADAVEPCRRRQGRAGDRRAGPLWQ